MKIISRAEAKAEGLNRYFTGKPCKRGHVCERTVSDRKCVECRNRHIKKYRKDNPEYFKEYEKIWRESNPEKARERDRRKREKNKCKESALDTLAMIANLSKLKEMDNK